MTAYTEAKRTGTAGARKHAVFVPGFVGFDALGQLRYYPGVTTLFQTWPGRRDDMTVDYFDNLPTASVAVRATRLLSFLAKKFSRGEIAPQDEVTLIGHSTGALDIRRTLRVLATTTTTPVSDGQDVPTSALLPTIKRIVFLSAPHYGTNIADYAMRFRPVIQGAVKDLGRVIQLNRAPVSDLRNWVSKWLPARADLSKAIMDALNESDENGDATPCQQAAERDAHSELALWLEHIGKDFGAIHDLASYSGVHATSTSPAHYTAQERAEEIAGWPAGLRTRSYVTTVPRPSSRPFETLARWLSPAAPLLGGVYGAANAVSESGLPVLSQFVDGARSTLQALPGLGLLVGLNAQPSALFDFVHAVCAHGPFALPADAMIAPSVMQLGGGTSIPSSSLGTRANDGIVNSASMLWPFVPESSDHEHFLVNADHADVIGHYAAIPRRRPESNRLFGAYDLFESGSGFKEAEFRELWHHIFAFVF